MSKKNTKLSRTLSLVLRHDPDAINLKLDPEGWANVDELIACMTRHKHPLDHDALTRIVTEGDKQRFRFSDDGQRIRANQGHSINIDFKFEEQTPPDHLYHGTAVRFMELIVREGLQKMTRHHVHLSSDVRSAHAVGNRLGKSIILEISAKAMAKNGFRFYLSENGVWLTDEVPPDYINRRFSV